MKKNRILSSLIAAAMIISSLCCLPVFAATNQNPILNDPVVISDTVIELTSTDLPGANITFTTVKVDGQYVENIDSWGTVQYTIEPGKLYEFQRVNIFVDVYGPNPGDNNMTSYESNKVYYFKSAGTESSTAPILNAPVLQPDGSLKISWTNGSVQDSRYELMNNFVSVAKDDEFLDTYLGDPEHPVILTDLTPGSEYTFLAVNIFVYNGDVIQLTSEPITYTMPAQTEEPVLPVIDVSTLGEDRCLRWTNGSYGNGYSLDTISIVIKINGEYDTHIGVIDYNGDGSSLTYYPFGHYFGNGLQYELAIMNIFDNGTDQKTLMSEFKPFSIEMGSPYCLEAAPSTMNNAINLSWMNGYLAGTNDWFKNRLYVYANGEQIEESPIELNAEDTSYVFEGDAGITYTFQIENESLGLGTKTTSNEVSYTIPLDSFDVEAESLQVAATNSTHTISYNNWAAGGQYDLLNAYAAGDYIEYSINVPTPGVYQLTATVMKSSNNGIYTLTIDGVEQATFDSYQMRPNPSMNYDLGEVTFLTAGEKRFRFTCTGKNNNSQGYKLPLDCISFNQPEEKPTLQDGKVQYEMESLVLNATNRSQTISNSDKASGNKFCSLNASGVNDFIEYQIYVPEAGTYSLTTRVMKYNNTGSYQCSVDGTALNTFDGYQTTGYYTDIDLGTMTFSTPGTKLIRFTCTGKNDKATGYKLPLDYLVLTKN